MVQSKAAMQTLEPAQAQSLEAAIGWLMLGNPAEAMAELNAMDESFQQHPDYLEVKWAVLAQEKDWTRALPVAHALVRDFPERVTGWLHFSYALRRVPEGGLEAAWNSLLPASEKFPKEIIVLYNLACYACQMGRLDDARKWLKRALKAGPKDKVKLMAMADGDLTPLHSEIDNM